MSVKTDGGIKVVKDGASEPSEVRGPATVRRAARTFPRGLGNVYALEDFEKAGRRHLPVPIFGYVAGIAENGLTAKANLSDWDRYRFVPKALQGYLDRDQGRTIFGRRYERCFAIAPMGLSALTAYDGDVVLAKAARERGTFAVMSATSLTSLERVAEEAGSRWFQAYFPGDEDEILAMIERVETAGYETLVVTVDVAMNGNRDTDMRNGFQTPLKVTPRLAMQGILRPRWLYGTALRTLRTLGMPHFENLNVEQGPAIVARDVVRSFRKREALNWDHVKAARERWKGNFVLKGILTPDDCALAREMGCDGVIVSNHGGRQLDGLPSALAALAGVKAVAGDMTVMLDSGVRRGTDVLKAIGLGADFVFAGRPFNYAAAVAGVPGVLHAIDILSTEIDRDMSLLGIRTLDEMTGERLAEAS